MTAQFVSEPKYADLNHGLRLRHAAEGAGSVKQIDLVSQICVSLAKGRVGALAQICAIDPKPERNAVFL